MKLLKLIVSLSVTATVVASTYATNLTGMMTVDNVFNAFISTDDSVTGTLIGSGNNWSVPQPVNGVLSAGQDYFLHIEAIDQGAPAMFIGSFNLSGTDHVFINNSQNLVSNIIDWQVSSSGFGSGYNAPSDLGPQGTSPWGSFAAIDPSAHFIWAPNTNTGTHYFSTRITAVPEPVTLSVAAGALLALTRKRRKA